VSYAVAGAMLGVTRQGVDLVTRGKLARHPGGRVLTAGVRDRIVQRSREKGSHGSAGE